MERNVTTSRASRFNWLIVVALFALTVCSSKGAASDSDAEKSATTASKSDATKPPIHLSPQATTGPKPPKITPPKPEEIESAIHRGIKFLLDDQRPDGSWGSPEHTKGLNIYAPPPGAHDAFRSAVTSLVIMA